MTTSASKHLYGTGYREKKANNTDEYLWLPVIEQLNKIKGCSRVLDAGCGNGYFLKHLIDKGYDASGVELDLSGVEWARKISPTARIELASLYDNVLDLFEQPFDAVVSLEVVEHLYDPRMFVKQMKRCLKPGGVFVITTPFHGYWKNLLIALLGKFDSHVAPLWDGGHIKFWSPKTLSALLGEFDIRVINFKGAGRIPLLWKSMVVTGQV